jgi:hypothetical protein
VCGLQAQPYFAENINAGADAKFGLPQLQHRLAAASAAAEAATSVVWTHAEGPPQGIDPNLASAAAAASVGLLPTRPEALAAAAVAAEAAAPFLGGTGAERQAAAVALGPEGFAALAQKVCWVQWAA